MAISSDLQDYIDNLSQASDCSLDDLVNKLKTFDVISLDDHGLIQNASDNERFEKLITILLNKGSLFAHVIIQKITELKTKWDSAKSRELQPLEDRRIRTSAEVSESWSLKVFLLNMAEKIGQDDFELMKDLVSGELGFTTAILEKLTTPMKMFKHMLTTRKINVYNTIYLQCVLWHLKRKDLMEEFVMFSAENQKLPIYFYAPKDEPENGYRYLKFYIGGDLSQMTGVRLEEFRLRVSRLLCIPLEFVFIAGIEPSNSLLLTFMLPENSVEIFINITQHNDQFVQTFELLMEIGKNVLIFRERHSKKDTNTSAQTSAEEQLKQLLAKEEKLKDELNDQAERLLDLQETKDTWQENEVIMMKHHETLIHESAMYRRMFHKALQVVEQLNITGEVVKNGHTPSSVPRLEMQSCLKLHTSLLAKAKESRIDMTLLSDILDVNSTLSAMQEKQKFVDILKEVRWMIQVLEDRANRVEFENYFLTASTLITGLPSNTLQGFLIKQEWTRPLQLPRLQLSVNVPLIPVVDATPGPLTIVPPLYPWHLEILKQITEDLNPRDCNKLRRILHLNETEKQILKKHSFRLLEIAVMQELQAGKNQTLENILSPILWKIQRKDLLAKYFPKPSHVDATLKAERET